MIKKLSGLLLLLSLLACSDSNNTAPNASSSSGNNTASNSAAPVMVEMFSEGIHYARLKTPVASHSDKIVVTEFFWYGCPHCEAFEPYLAEWDKKKPADVILEKSPAIWQEAMKLHARLYFLAHTLDNADALHAALFKEVMAQRAEQNMEVQNQKFAQVFAQFGLNEDEYKKQIQSAAIEAQLATAIELMQQAGVSGTPAVMVNGKYMVLNDNIKSLEEILAIAEFLINKERQAQKSGSVKAAG